jgi:hypothetical protein
MKIISGKRQPNPRLGGGPSSALLTGSRYPRDAMERKVEPTENITALTTLFKRRAQRPIFQRNISNLDIIKTACNFTSSRIRKHKSNIGL